MMTFVRKCSRLDVITKLLIPGVYQLISQCVVRMNVSGMVKDESVDVGQSQHESYPDVSLVPRHMYAN